MKRSVFQIVLVSCGGLPEARRIARAAIENRVAACANISLAPVESIYRWKEKLEVAREYLLAMKTVGARLAELRQLVHELHSYEVPEFVVLPIVGGSDKYLRWLAESVSRAPRRRK